MPRVRDAMTAAGRVFPVVLILLVGAMASCGETGEIPADPTGRAALRDTAGENGVPSLRASGPEPAAPETPGSHAGEPRAAAADEIRMAPAGSVLEDYRLDAGNAKYWELPGRLREISGLAMTRDHRLLAHNDEEGLLFEIDLQNGSTHGKFELADSRGRIEDDFEGIAVTEDRIYLVSSSGKLYEFEEEDVESVLFSTHATGTGRHCEVEGLAYDAKRKDLLLLCKEPRSEDLRGKVAVFRWSTEAKRSRPEPPLVIPESDFGRHLGDDRFRPSGIELHPVTGHYFIVAAAQDAIAEVTPEGQVVSVTRLDARWHRQTEGVAFDPEGALILADEGGRGNGRLTMYAAPGRPR